MRGIPIPSQLFGHEGPEPAAEPWPPLFDNGDEHTILVDEMFARQLDPDLARYDRMRRGIDRSSAGWPSTLDLLGPRTSAILPRTSVAGWRLYGSPLE